MIRPFRRLAPLVLLACALGLPVAAADLPPPETVPPADILVEDDANQLVKDALDARYDALHERWAAWTKRNADFTRMYTGREFPDGSAEAVAGTAERKWLVETLGAYKKDAADFATDCLKLRIDRRRSIALMADLVGHKGWGDAKAKRTRTLMEGLRLDGDRTAGTAEIAAAWRAIAARDADAALTTAFAKEAAAGDGPTLSGIGTQSFNDCTIFALAAAAGRPYGVVAAAATEVIRDGRWRAAADRHDPQQVIERHGLNGDEVILIAESFGQASLVPSKEFAKTLRAGAPVLVCINLVVGPARDPKLALHETVLSRTFRHGGETWFEMMDSNLDIGKRHYVSEKELLTLLEENGVAYRAEPGRTPVLLRPPSAP